MRLSSMAPTTRVNSPTNKTNTEGGDKITESKKQKHGGKTGKRKQVHSRYKDPSKMCWDLCPMFAYDVKDVNKPNKYILLVITCILWCFSVVIVCMGAYLIIQRKSREEVISAGGFSHFWLDISLVLLCNGLVSSVITFCGLVGVLRETVPLIRVFYISLIVVLVLKFSLAVFVFVFADYSRPLLEGMLAEQAVVDYRASSDVETLLDYLQTSFRCCGLRDDGFQDWSRNVYFNCSSANPSPERCGVPWSCCRNHTGVSNPLCGKNVQKLDRNIASRSIHTMGCLHAVQLWVSSHAVAAGLVGLLEVTVIVAVTFQCTRIVNELQMINGVYCGPWWDRLLTAGKAKPKKQRKAKPRDTSTESPRSPRPSPGPSAQLPSTGTPSEVGETSPDVGQQRTKLTSVVQIGHGPAVRRTKIAAAPAGKISGPAGKVSGQPPGEESKQPQGDEFNQLPSEASSQQPDEISSQPPDEASNQSSGEISTQLQGEISNQPPGEISNQLLGEVSNQEPDEIPTIVVVDTDSGRVNEERVFSTSFMA